ncbi:phosphatidate cytidylyltransferase [Pendulispora rubella]|uniref:Phosphatidate cytidylyltransferase n=1 Tax=Pendulispora rubella TaxID=2741070 RepID=A0ABZ2KWT1_9BACT
MAVTKSNLAMRLLTAAVAVPVILFLLYKCPPYAFYFLAFPAALVGSFELFSMTHPGDRVSQIVGVLLSAAASLLVWFYGHDPRVLLTMLVAIPLLGPLLTLVRVGDISSAALRACAMGFGPLFVALPMTMLAMLRRDMQDDGPGYVLVTLMFAWLADTGGYFAGRFLGKHKLYELVSPKKTVEGAVGGLAGSVVGALLASLVYLPAFPLAHSIPLAIVASALGQAGDLGESLLKRSTGVKDSGAIVPGHGGVLDRIDALLLTSTAVYLYTLWVHH